MADADRFPDLLAVALDVARQLERQGIPYLVGGSLASSVHGEPRSTLDVDMVIDLRPEHVQAFGESLHPRY